jgi:predicted N-formylglutamate amidohydrolase
MHFPRQIASEPRLLADDELPAVTLHNKGGGSPFLLVADHAGNAIPRALRSLGISHADRARHIAWDVGIAGLSRLLADALDATLIQQNYSRLVIDCNRPLGTDMSIPALSELTPVPGNVGLHDADKATRVRGIFRPYHAAIEAELDRRRQGGQPTALVSMHSFTPSYHGVARPWHAGVLYHRDRRLARLLLALLRREPGLVVGDNEPYDVTDATDYTIPVHGERRSLHHVGIEIRQDLIADEQGQRHWAARLARLLTEAYQSLAVDPA